MRKKIWVNTLVYNEENFLWFAVMSIADYVDKILLWDTGSTDNTLKVIDELKNKLGDKIMFKKIGRVSKDQYTKVRQEMLDQTNSDWVIILDGDEVWWKDSIKKVTELIQGQGDKLDSVVVPFKNCLGDIFHFQEESAGRYKIDDKVGNITIKAINRTIKGLHLQNPYGQEGYFDDKNVPIQERDKKKRKFLDAPFLHMTHLKRTALQNPKFKHETGLRFPQNFKYPEVFYLEKPDFISSPLYRRSKIFTFKAGIYNIPRKLKRKLFT